MLCFYLFLPYISTLKYYIVSLALITCRHIKLIKGHSMSTTVFCRYCGDHIIDSAKDCQHCGAEQHLPSAFGGVASKNAQGLFAFIYCLLLGVFGVHRFVYGKKRSGVFM